jgi:hypothetical protein
MRNVWKQVELIASMPRRVGLLRDVCRVLNSEGIDIRSIEAYDNGDRGEFYLITSDDDLATSKLAEMEADIASAEVVCAELDNRPGALLALAEAIADAGINIWQMRCTSTATNDTALVVFRVEDPDALVNMLSGL